MSSKDRRNFPLASDTAVRGAEPNGVSRQSSGNSSCNPLICRDLRRCPDVEDLLRSASGRGLPAHYYLIAANFEKKMIMEAAWLPYWLAWLSC